MSWFSNHQDSYDTFQSTPKHEASLTHEVIAGAAAFEAAKAYEDHCARNGQPDNYALAKELAAGFAGAAVDRLAETKGLDAYDNWQQRRQEAKRLAEQHCVAGLQDDYN